MQQDTAGDDELLFCACLRVGRSNAIDGRLGRIV